MFDFAIPSFLVIYGPFQAMVSIFLWFLLFVFIYGAVKVYNKFTQN